MSLLILLDIILASLGKRMSVWTVDSVVHVMDKMKQSVRMFPVLSMQYVKYKMESLAVTVMMVSINLKRNVYVSNSFLYQMTHFIHYVIRQI